MEINPHPMLSVILVSQQGKPASIESALLSLLGQSYRPCEVILVMPKKEQEQEQYWESLNALVARWKVAFSDLKLIEVESGHKSDGAYYAMGLKQASGHYLSFMDDTHRIYPYTFAKLIAYLQEHQECIWAFANIGVALVNEHEQVVERLDPDPTYHYVGVDYLEQDAICPSGFVIDRNKLPGLFDLETILAQVSLKEMIALLTLEAKPGNVPILGGETRKVQMSGCIQGEMSAPNLMDKRVLPWWLGEFQAQKAAQAFMSKSKLDPTLHQTLVDEQSFYYRQLYMAYRQSTCGKIVRVLLRNYEPTKELHTQIAELPKTEIEAINKIILLQSHPLWELTAPIRWFGKLRSQ